MIEDFSAGYYRAPMQVQTYDNGPAIQRDLYNFINYELYGDSSPVVMRLGLDADEHFSVDAEGAIPSNVLAVPDSMVEQEGEQSVFVLKSSYIPSTVGGYHG